MMLSKSRKIGIAIWFIAFTLTVFLLLVIPDSVTGTIIVTLIFDAIAFISVLILWLSLFKNSSAPKDVFYRSPAMTVSTAYLVIQSIISIIVGLLADAISFKVSLILNFVIMAVVWVIILFAIGTKDFAKRVDSRQRDHHSEL